MRPRACCLCRTNHFANPWLAKWLVRIASYPFHCLMQRRSLHCIPIAQPTWQCQKFTLTWWAASKASLSKLSSPPPAAHPPQLPIPCNVFSITSTPTFSIIVIQRKSYTQADEQFRNNSNIFRKTNNPQKKQPLIFNPFTFAIANCSGANTTCYFTFPFHQIIRYENKKMGTRKHLCLYPLWFIIKSGQ